MKKSVYSCFNEMAKFAACSNKSFHAFHPSIFKYLSDSADAIHSQHAFASRILQVTKISGNQFFALGVFTEVKQSQTVSEE